MAALFHFLIDELPPSLNRKLTAKLEHDFPGAFSVVGADDDCEELEVDLSLISLGVFWPFLLYLSPLSSQSSYSSSSCSLTCRSRSGSFVWLHGEDGGLCSSCSFIRGSHGDGGGDEGGGGGSFLRGAGCSLRGVHGGGGGEEGGGGRSISFPFTSLSSSAFSYSFIFLAHRMCSTCLLLLCQWVQCWWWMGGWSWWVWVQWGCWWWLSPFSSSFSSSASFYSFSSAKPSDCVAHAPFSSAVGVGGVGGSGSGGRVGCRG